MYFAVQTAFSGQHHDFPPADNADVDLWDSLFLADLAEQGLPRASTPQGMLVHYLPFNNPALSHLEKTRLEKQFDLAVQHLDFLIATGQRAECLLRQKYPSMPLGLAEPGVDEVFLSGRGLAPTRNHEPPVRLVTVANLLPAKGHLLLLGLLEKLSHLAFEWHLIGATDLDPAYVGQFRAEAENKGLSQRIIFHGAYEKERLAAKLSGMDVCVMPSLFESYGMALAEAVAAGLPALANPVGEADRMVRHGQNGLLVPIEKGAEFTEALAQMIADGGFREQLTRSSLQLEPRSWYATVADLKQFLQCVIPVPSSRSEDFWNDRNAPE